MFQAPAIPNFLPPTLTVLLSVCVFFLFLIFEVGGGGEVRGDSVGFPNSDILIP